MKPPVASRWPNLRPRRIARLVGLWIATLGFFLVVPGLVGAIPEPRTPADQATMGLVVSFFFMIGWMVITQVGFDSPNWSLMYALPLGRDQVLRALVIERSPMLVVPLIVACSFPLGTKGIDALFHGQTILIATLYSLLALAEVMNSRPWWGDLVFPVRCVVRMTFHFLAVIWSESRGPLAVLLCLMGIFGGFTLANVVETNWGVPLLGGTQVWLYGLGPATIPLFLVISPFSLPYLMTHPATNTPESVGWVTAFGLVGLNLLAGWALYARWREWEPYVPLEMMAIESLSEEAVQTYFEQDENELLREAEAARLFGRRPGASPDDLVGGAPRPTDEENDEHPSSREELEPQAKSQIDERAAGPDEMAPAGPGAAVATAASPPRRRIDDPESLVEYPLLPKVSTLEAFRLAWRGEGFWLPIGILLFLSSSVIKGLAQAGPEGLRAFAVLIVLFYFTGRAQLLAGVVANQLPKRSALPLTWRGMFRHYVLGSIGRDWWHVVPAFVALVCLTFPTPGFLLFPVLLILVATYGVVWVMLRYKGESTMFDGGTGAAILLIGIIVPGAVFLLGSIIVSIDYLDKAPPAIQAAFWYWSIAVFVAYVALLASGIVLFGSRGRDDAVVTPLT